MNWVRVAALLFAIGVHAGVVFALLGSAPGDPALQDGHGNDELTVAATVTMEDDQTFGLDRETKAEQNSVAPQQKEEVKEEAVQKPEEPKLADPEPAKPVEAPLPPEEKPPVKEAETPPPPPLPEAKSQLATPQIDPEEEQRAASRALEGRRTKQASVYLSEVYSALGRHKVRPEIKPDRARVGIAHDRAFGSDHFARCRRKLRLRRAR